MDRAPSDSECSKAVLRYASRFATGLLLCLPRLVSAQQPTGAVEVAWQAEGTCAQARFETELRRLLDASPAGVRVQVTVASAQGGWVLEADFEGGDGLQGTRRFEASTCETVSDAAALAIALAVDPTVLEQLEEPMEPDEPDEPEAPVAIPEPEAVAPPAAGTPPTSEREAPAPPASPTPPRRLWGALSLRGSVDAGALPGPGGGVSLGATLGVDVLRVEVVGGYRFATSTDSTRDPSISAEFTAWSIGARALWAPSVGPVEFPLGAGIEAGQIAGEGVGLPGLRREARVWVAPEAIAGVHWWFSPHVAVLARAVLGVPLYRPSFSVEGLETLHQVGAVQIRGVFGFEARFP